MHFGISNCLELTKICVNVLELLIIMHDLSLDVFKIYLFLKTIFLSNHRSSKNLTDNDDFENMVEFLQKLSIVSGRRAEYFRISYDNIPPKDYMELVFK